MADCSEIELVVTEDSSALFQNDLEDEALVEAILNANAAYTYRRGLREIRIFSKTGFNTRLP